MVKTSRIVATVTHGSAASISRHWERRAGTLPVTPTSASSGWPASRAAQSRAIRVSSPIEVPGSKKRNVIAVVESSREPGTRRAVFTSGSAKEMPSPRSSRAVTARSATRVWASSLRPSGSRCTTAV
jgi:hypothetical protein